MSNKPDRDPLISLDEYARRLVDAAPPFTAEQEDLIRGIFAPVVAALVSDTPCDTPSSA